MSDDAPRKEEHKGPPPWMLSLADLISLLLTFFVMLFAMSKVKIDRWDEVVDALSQSIKPSPVEDTDEPMANMNIPRVYRKPAMNLDYLSAVIDDAIDDNAVLGDARMSREADKLVISLPGDLLFFAGSSEMTPKARQALFVLGGVLRNIGNRIGVQGHTDPRPLSGRGQYASNWELSLARAGSVANELKQSGYTDYINIYGFAASRYDQLPKLLDEEARFEMARRVDIVIEPHGGSGIGGT
ncbi:MULTISPECIES: flagellar motor protein MotB [Thalassospira]|jgi:chemotaxis protein MotB|uniref:Chemotaxis protein MotB n=1 Tax=Thalassospira profundimaris TaxID=502049 RepID=A0A367VAX5_9PROT|nr:MULTISPECIES: flagellar motor protein MotB [Thalassospira]MBR9902178.1 OmpA family protein [Rhodospirillales bacterium]HAI28517.1 chemotaxis protein MotB [Thalassospira sp.]KZB72194.1 chemotaxis protein MotB [Thalassospira sp. MCCC 1A01148]MBS8274672.1 chemotaxis protein MotB [Thalassospira tepidiphila]RCK21390.1 chemotaxis protein MotB [Thalassospira profundimaris]|tara:strand:- start:4324 stop:5049 length:726 start_codon:yes stop_codon:yes gene_type:complete